MNEEVQSKIQQLSMLEQNLQNFASQRQQYQAQLLEVESAQNETSGSKEVYKIIGNIMVLRDAAQIRKELDERKEMLRLRIESFDKQEGKIKEKAEALQKEIVAGMKEDKKGE